MLMLEECIEGDGEMKNDGNEIPEPKCRVLANKFEDQSWHDVSWETETYFQQSFFQMFNSEDASCTFCAILKRVLPKSTKWKEK